MTGRWWTAARVAGGLAVLGVLAAQLGTEPFVAGLQAVGPGPAAARAGSGRRAPPCAAPSAGGSWSRVAYGVDVTLRAATAAYYRSQFLNSVLPGGVLGDVHRGLTHRTDPLGGVGAGPGAGRRRRARPARRAGRLAGRVRTVHDGPRRAGGRRHRRGRRPGRRAGQPRRARARASCRRSWRSRRWRRRATQRSSSSRHARSASTPRPTTLAPDRPRRAGRCRRARSTSPGWGPREGAAAWAFAAAGLGAAAGASVAVAYGVLALLATLPGAVLLVVRRPAPAARPTRGTAGRWPRW